MAQSHVNEFQDLAERFMKATNSQEDQVSLESIRALKYEDLQNRAMDFGKSKLGLPFREVIQDNRYVSWFVKSYGTSQKPTHVRLLHFVKLHVERLERTNSTRPKSKALPRNVPTSKTPGSPSSSEQEPEELEISSWEQVHPQEQEVAALQERVGNMENMMQQILSHLTQGQTSSRAQ